jgi:hypothetical protein
MPNRVIRDSILTSASVDGMTADEERLFFRLLLIVDDFGRFDARPAVIRGRAFALKTDLSDDSILLWLARLAELEVVLVYEVRGKRFVCFPNWEVYQKRRAQTSKWPAPEEGVLLSREDIANPCRQMIASASKCSQPPADVPVVVDVDDGRESKTRSKSSVETLRPAVAEADEDFGPLPVVQATTTRPAPVVDASGQASLLPSTSKPDRRRKPAAEPEEEPTATADLERWVARYVELKSPQFPPALTKEDRIFFFQQRKARGIDELVWVLETLHPHEYSGHLTIRQLLSAESAQRAAGLKAKAVQSAGPQPTKYVTGRNLKSLWEGEA